MKKWLSVSVVAIIMALSAQSFARTTHVTPIERLESSCSNYPKPATCNAHPHCHWQGSCVPR